MSLFFIQQYIVAQTTQFLTEIQTTVQSALHHNPNPNSTPTIKIVNLSHVMSWLTDEFTKH